MTTTIIKYEFQGIDNVSPIFTKIEGTSRKAIATTAKVSESIDKLQKIKIDDKDILSLTNRLKDLANVSKTAQEELSRISATKRNIAIPAVRAVLPNINTEDLLKTTSTGKVNLLTSNQQLDMLTKGTSIIKEQVDRERVRLQTISKQADDNYKEFYNAVKKSANEFLNKDSVVNRSNLAASKNPPKELYLQHIKEQQEAELEYTKNIKEQIAIRVAEKKKEIAINKEVDSSIDATLARLKNLETVRKAMLASESAIKEGKLKNASLISDKDIYKIRELEKEAKELIEILTVIDSKFKLSSSSMGQQMLASGASYLKGHDALTKYLREEEELYTKHLAKMREEAVRSFTNIGYSLGKSKADARIPAPHPSNINSQLGMTARINTPVNAGTLQAVREQIDFENLILKHGANSSVVIRRQMENELLAITKEGNAKILAADKHLADMEKTHDNSRINAAIINRNALYNTYAQKLKDTEALHANSLATALNSERHIQNSESLITNARASQHLLTRIFQFDIGYRIANNALNTFMSALQSVPSVGIAWESANATFKAVFSTIENVNAQFAFLDELALKTGASITILREQFGQFASSAKFSGESIGKIQQIFTDITMAGAVLHLPADKLKSAFVAINQMYAKNQVMMEELKKQLGNQLPAAVAIFALSMGVSTRKLMEDMKKGLVLPKETIAKFAATYRDFFADTSSFAQAANGLNAELGRLSSSWTYLVQGVYEGVHGVIIGVVKTANNILITLKNNLNAVAIASGLAFGVGVTSFLGHYISKLALAAVTAETAGKAYKALAAANIANFAAGNIGGASAGLAALTAKGTSGTFWEKLTVIFPDILANLAKFAKFASILGAVTSSIYAISQAEVKVGDTTVKVADIVALGFTKMKTSAKEFFDTIEISPFGKLLLGMDKLLGFSYGISKQIMTQPMDIKISKESIKKGGFQSLIDDIFKGTELANEVATNNKKIEESLAEKLKSDKIVAAIKDDLIKGSEQGSEEMVAAIQTKISKYLETFNKLSDAINATADLQAKAGLHIIQLEQQAIEKDFKANRISFLQYYETRVALAEKEYQIALKKNELEKGIAIYGLNEARRFKDISTVEYSSVSKDKAATLLKDIENISSATRLGKDGKHELAGIMIDDTVPLNVKLNEARIALVNENLKAEQARINLIKEENRNKPIEQQQALSAQEEYILSLKEVATFYRTDLEAKHKLLSTYEAETAKGFSDVNKAMSTAIVNIEDKIVTGVGIDGGAKLLKDSAARMQTLESSRGSSIANQVTAIATAEGVKNVNGFLANVMTESNLNQNAISPVGAIGISQVMPSNTYAKGLDLNTTDGNITAGSRYWAHLEQKYNNDLTKVAAAYNAGERGVDVKHADTKYPETVNHVARVKELEARINKLTNTIPSELAPISAEINKHPIASKFVSAPFKGESKIIQADIKNLEAQYAKEKVLEELETLRLEHIEKMRDAYTSSNIEVLKLTEGNGKQITLLENEIKYKNELTTLNAMQQAHSELDKAFNEARTEEERKLIELKRSEYIPLTKEELRIQKENVNTLEERANVLAEINEYRRVQSIRDTSASLAEKDISLGASAGDYGQFGEMQRRSSFFQSEYTRKNAAPYREAEYAKIRQQYSDPDEANNKIKEFNQGLEETRQKGEELNNYFANNISDSIGTAMTDWATGNKSVEDSLRSLGVTFLKMVMDMIVQEIILTGVRLALKAASAGIFGGGGEVGASTGGILGAANGGHIKGYANGGNILAFPNGGRVKGTGTETSDSNYAVVPKGSYVIKASSSNKLANKHGNMLVKLSNNETVIPPEMVNAYGKDFFDYANKNGELKFADGGLTSPSNVVNFPKGNTKVHNNATNNIVVNVQSNGKESSTEMGQKISIEIVKQIAKAEAKREVNVNNKMNRVSNKRVA